MGDSESDVGATPVIGRVAVGVCAAANLTILGVIITDALSSSASAVLSAMAPPSGRLGLLAFGLGASVNYRVNQKRMRRPKTLVH